MKFVWDDQKRVANLSKHRLDFADLIDFEWMTAKVEESRPGRYQPRRFRAVGIFRAKLCVVIFTELGSEALSIVSFRVAGTRERGDYNG